MPQARIKAKNYKMEDVARAANVSISTVSRAFSQPDRVDPETREAIFAEARRLNYVRDLTAGSLAAGRSRIVAAVVPVLTNAIFSETIDGLGHELASRGYQLLLGQSWYRDGDEHALIEAFLGRKIDGLVVTGQIRDRALRAKIKQSGVPTVETWEMADKPLDMMVGFSNEAAAAAAARYLIGRGYRELGFIGGMDQRSQSRWEGFSQAAIAAGAPPPSAYRIHSPAPSSVVAGGEGLRTLLAERPNLRAVFCSNDMIASGAVFACQRLGLAVPNKMAVMGFSNLPIGAELVPPLTTIQVSAREIGVCAAKMILDRVEGRTGRPAKLDLGFSVIARGSA